MTNIVKFNETEIQLINHNNQNCMTCRQIADVLGMATRNGATDLYNAHKEEFTEEMTCLIKQGRTRVRIFNREGAWLIGMFARTEQAADFRKWVLKVLGNVADKNTADNSSLIEVSAHTRRLPSGKKEIVLSEKARSEIGGIVKAVLQAQMINRENIREILRSVIREEIADYILKEGIKQSRFNNKPTADGLPVANWVCGIIHGANALNNLIEQLCIRQKNAVDLLESKN